MTPEAGDLIRTVGAVAAAVGLIGSAAGTVIGSQIGVKWLEKRQNDLREWMSELNGKVIDHGERISKVEGICEERRKQPGKC